MPKTRDLSLAVFKGHLLIEEMLTEVITSLLPHPEFIDGRFHTAYLDEVLQSRNGRPFVQPTAEAEEMAAIGAVLQAILSPDALTTGKLASAPEAARRWKAQGRAEALR